MPDDVSIRRLEESDWRFAWRLNQSEIPQVGAETFPKFKRLCTISVFAALAVMDGERAGFLLGMTADADYDSPNFTWFRERYPQFLYVDRIAVVREQRSRGVGRALYAEAEGHARQNGLSLLCCEVNLIPPNPRSMAFHAKLGFVQAGSQVAHGKTVAMLVKQLGQ